MYTHILKWTIGVYFTGGYGSKNMENKCKNNRKNTKNMVTIGALKYKKQYEK